MEKIEEQKIDGQEEIDFYCHDFDWEEIAENVKHQISSDLTPTISYYDRCDTGNRAWETFFNQSQNRFFKDRHYMPKLLDQELSVGIARSHLVIVDLGCGVGNTIFPIIKHLSKYQLNKFIVHAVDFSPAAIQCLQEHPLYSPTICRTYVDDMTSQSTISKIGMNVADVAVMIFSLSALARNQMASAFLVANSVLKVGGHLVVRDYGLYDLAQLRYARHGNKRIEENSYLRGDYTRVCFLELEELKNLARSNGFRVVEVDYHTVRLHNRKMKTKMDRVWIHGRFEKIKTLSEKKVNYFPTILTITALAAFFLGFWLKRK
eukprot:c28192_g1_i1.p1 GENE.c28192_g1_i1~~c28192_g1_i1.p1  ORF type:complete len:330 (+),score=116.74 c28192_g1_i1:34-990(+)